MSEESIRAVPTIPVSGPPQPGENKDHELRLARLPKNDVGNAQRFIERRGRDFAFVRQAGWYGYDGKRWNQREGEALVRRGAQGVADAIRFEAAAMDSDGPQDGEKPGEHKERVAAHFKWAVASGNAAKLNGMIGEASPHLECGPDEFDAEIFVFNAANGAIDLGPLGDGDVAVVRLRGFDRRDRLTRISPVDYADDKKPRVEFEKFLAKVLPDAAVRLFLQIFFGLCLTGDISEQIWVLLEGEGNDGKSTLLDIIAYVLGEFAGTIPIASLMMSNNKTGAEASPDWARLPGARLVMAREPKAGAVFDESILKMITGERSMSARKLHKEFFDFRPTFKLVVACNRKPRIVADDDGTWRRPLVVPFTVQIPADAVDKHFFDEKLVPEAEGILQWLIEGYCLWRAGGLVVPEAVRKASDAYRADSDPLGEWWEDGVEVTRNPMHIVTADELRRDYETWCHENGHEAITKALFGRRIAAKKGVTKRKSGTVRYLGIRLKRYLAKGKEVAGPGDIAPPPMDGREF